MTINRPVPTAMATFSTTVLLQCMLSKAARVKGSARLYVVGADSGGEHRNPLAVLVSGDPYELARSAAALHGIQKRFEHADPAGVSDEEDRVGQLFGLDMQMERGTVRVDNQF